VIAYHLLKRKEKYIELGINYFDQKNAEALKRSLVRRLERLGHSVTLGAFITGTLGERQPDQPPQSPLDLFRTSRWGDPTEPVLYRRGPVRC